MVAGARAGRYPGQMEPLIVVGGGLLGCAVAHAAARGRSVTVLERAIIGAEASSAAAGILAPRVEAHGREPLRSIGIESLDAWERWIRALGAEPDAVGYRRCGALVVRGSSGRGAASPDDPPDPEARWLPDARLRVPELAEGGAWWLPDEGVVDPRKVIPAARAAAERAGVRIHACDPVVRVESGGVELASGRFFRGEVVVCAGAWSAQVPGAPRVPVRPVRGQLVALEGVPLPTVVFGPGGYLVPRWDDARVIAGATVEEAGFEKRVTAEGLRAVLDTALRLAPGLARASVAESWAGLRPGTPDEMPILGRVDGVWVASGHYRNGILLAPWTARTVADAVLDGAELPKSFGPERFLAPRDGDTGA